MSSIDATAIVNAINLLTAELARVRRALDRIALKK